MPKTSTKASIKRRATPVLARFVMAYLPTSEPIFGSVDPKVKIRFRSQPKIVTAIIDKSMDTM